MNDRKRTSDAIVRGVDAQQANEFDMRQGLAGEETKPPRTLDRQKREEAEKPGSTGRVGTDTGASGKGPDPQPDKRLSGKRE